MRDWIRSTSLLFVFSTSTATNGQVVDFDTQIAPLLATRCLDCHSRPDPKGGLDLRTAAGIDIGGESGAALVPSDPAASLLWQRIEADEMPPESRLSAAEKLAIRDWIATGAKWGVDSIDPFRYSSDRRAGYDWWSLQPLATDLATDYLPMPGSANPIDRFIARQLGRQGLKPSSRAPPRVLVRRLFFDLVGLPPSVQTVDRFVADPSDKAWHALVDRLLDSPHYGERWARHWLDVARFGESNGFEYNERREHAYHYRDWVIRSLNDDMPYNQFVRMQIAGDIIADDPIQGAAAVGFLVAGPHNTILGNSDAMKQTARHEELEEIAGTTAQAFLGLTVNCARCHDHKFDPISTKEYYQFIAALDGVGFGNRRIPKLGDVDNQRMLSDQLESLATRRQELFAQRSDKINSVTNIATTRQPIEANERGQVYTVALSVAPTTFADLSQATTAEDAIEVHILRQDQSILARKAVQPRPWNHDSDDHHFSRLQFSYRGDGTGNVKIRLRPRAATARFAGAVDDLTVHDSRERIVFQSGFDGIEHVNPAQFQATTGMRVFFGSSSNTWQSTGGNAIHVVEVSAGNFALQLFSGDPTQAPPLAETAAEQQIETQLREVQHRMNQLSAVTIHTVAAGEPGVMHVRVRGDATQIGQPVSPAGLGAIVGVSPAFDLPPDASDADRRRKLAEWMTDRDNGPFHRVLVNRIWYHHFGAGIVATPNDFGFNGGRPSHPELLDWLAIWFREHGYSVKSLHRLMVTSQTYRQSSAPTDNQTRRQAERQDSDNRFLWRYNLRRADAEYVRDSMLMVAGALNTHQFGPGFVDVRTDEVGAARYYVAIDPVGNSFNRRTIYRWQARGERSSLLETFDCPDPSTTAPKRNITTTPTQALSQWNHPFVIRMAERLALRVSDELGEDAELADQIDHAWRLVLGRYPGETDRALCLETAARHGLAAVCRVLLNSNESIIIE